MLRSSGGRSWKISSDRYCGEWVSRMINAQSCFGLGRTYLHEISQLRIVICRFISHLCTFTGPLVCVRSTSSCFLFAVFPCWLGKLSDYCHRDAVDEYREIFGFAFEEHQLVDDRDSCARLYGRPSIEALWMQLTVDLINPEPWNASSERLSMPSVRRTFR